jgi:hypothetical protein
MNLPGELLAGSYDGQEKLDNPYNKRAETSRRRENALANAKDRTGWLRIWATHCLCGSRLLRIAASPRETQKFFQIEE